MKHKFFSAFLVILIISGVFFIQKNFLNRKSAVQYQTAKAEKGTLITSISGSGSITSGNNTNITTKVSGVVNKVYVTNGDAVIKGQKIAEITLDDYAQERQTAAWVKYLEATEAVKDAQKAKVTADIQMWKDRQAVLDAQEEVVNKNLGRFNPDTGKLYTLNEQTIVDKTLDEADKAFSASESKYLDADADIANARAKVASTLRDYQENSATIIAFSSGVISDLTLAPSVVIAASSTTSNTSGATIVSASIIGKISNPDGQLTATVTLTEIDIISVKANQKVILTLDAYPDKTFTGKVLAVNTSGSVNSGVTSYPVTILLDSTSVEIYPNMAVSVEIITAIKNDVILIPSTAVQTTNNQATVGVMKNGKVTEVSVEIGSSNDSQTEIVSGISEGDEVVTSTNQINTNSATSPFSGLGGRTSGNSGNRMIIQEGPRGGF